MNQVDFWRGSFFRPIVLCVVRKCSQPCSLGGSSDVATGYRQLQQLQYIVVITDKQTDRDKHGTEWRKF